MDDLIGGDAGDVLQGMIVNEIRADNLCQFRLEGPRLQLQVVKGFINAMEGEQGRHGVSG